MIFELLILIALCITGYYFLFHKKSGATSPISSQDNDTIVKNPTLDQRNTQEMVVGLTDNITQNEIASPEIKTAPPVVVPSQEEPHEVKEDFSQKEVSQERLPLFVENSNIQKEDQTETKEFVPTEVEQTVFDKEIVEKQPEIVFEEQAREEQGALLQETDIFENKAVEEKEILPDVQADENILKEVQEEAVYEKPQEEYNVDVQKELTRPEEELTVPKEIEIFPEEKQETPKEIEEAHQELENKPEIIDVEKPEIEAETYEQEFEAEKEKAEEVVNPFADEQVTTDEKPIFENIQQEDVLKKEAEELPPVVEDIEENLFVTKDQEIAVGDVEKPEIEVERYEQEYEAEKEKAEEVVNPFADEQQVATDEKPIFEDLQQEDILKREVFEPVVENIAVETQEEEKPFIELAEVSAPIEEPTKHEELENQEEKIQQEQVHKPIGTLQDQEIKADELIEEEAVKPIKEEEESPVIEENPFVHNQVEEVITQEEEKPIIETPLISELQQPLDDTEKVENREKFLAKEDDPISEPIHVEEAQKETVQEEITEPKDQEIQTSAKKVTRKGFNFRTNKTKIESILPKLETPEKQSISEFIKTTEETQVFPTPLTFEEKGEQSVEDLINELGTPIQLVKYQSSEIDTPFSINEPEKIETQPEPEQPVEKTTAKRGFNFRTKKNKIESILQEGSEKSSSGEILKESLIEEPQVQKEREPFIKEIETIQVPETEKNEFLAENIQKEPEPFIKEIETIQVPEVEVKEIEPVSEPEPVKAPTKRGFNFRANKSKIGSFEKSLSQGYTKLSAIELLEEKPLEILQIGEKSIINEEAVVKPIQEEPQVQNDVPVTEVPEEKPLETLPVEEKPMINEEVPMIPTQEEPQDKVSSKRGFNFRTKKNKIEAMLTTSVDTPEKKPVVEGSEKYSSGEFHSSMHQQETPAAFEEKQEEIEQKVLHETSPIKRVESLPAAEQETLEEERDLKAKTMGGAKRSFNFRGNKRRIDSILKKDSSGHLDLSGAEDQNSLSNILESTVNTSMTHSTEDVLGQREENIISLGEETIEPQTKRKGFNFRNAKKKTVIESPQKQDENSIVSGIIEESPQKSENVLAESGKGEVKKSKGFNFRNPNRVKAD